MWERDYEKTGEESGCEKGGGESASWMEMGWHDCLMSVPGCREGQLKLYTVSSEFE
jgi:hypothetical protein